MKIPQCEKAYILPAKLLKYLLDPTSPKGRHKAREFRKYGYSLDNADELEGVLLHLARRSEVREAVERQDGIQYILIEELPPSRRYTSTHDPEPFRVVWQIDAGTELPRFITAYPQRWKESGQERT